MIKDLSQLTVCILTHNRCEQVLKSLERIICELSDSKCSILILDNKSSDNSVNAISLLIENYDCIKIIKSIQNLGVSKGREVLWAQAKTKYILSLDDDILLRKRDVENLLLHIERSTNIGIVSPEIIDSNSGRVLNPININNLEALSFYEACFMFRRSVLQKVGYFDSELSVAGEGLDYSIRLRRCGFKIMRTPDVKVIHVDRQRSIIDISERKLVWAWSFSYVFWKNFAFPIATMKTFRLFIAHIHAGIPKYGVKHLLALVIYIVRGAKLGGMNRQKNNT